MHLQLKEKLITQECSDYTQLATRASRIEHFISEKEQRSVNRVNKVPHLVSIVDNDRPIEITNFLDKQPSEAMVDEILKRRPYLCPTLRLLKGKEVARSESKEKYLFNISKVD